MSEPSLLAAERLKPSENVQKDGFFSRAEEN
jgi:hypothetical protein